LALGWADPFEMYRRIAAFIESNDVQRSWAPAFGASRELCVPLEALAHPDAS
jgi:hypothetical protein